MSSPQAQVDGISTSIQERRDPDQMQVVSHRHRENGKRQMNGHHDLWFINIPLSVLLVSTPWWLAPVTQAIEQFHWLAGMLILPVLGIALALLQIVYMVRKHKQLGGKDSK
jgi:hypothetical protein